MIKERIKQETRGRLGYVLLSLLLGPLGVLAVVVVLVLAVAGASTDENGGGSDPIPVACNAPVAGGVAALDPEQAQNAATIIAVGKRRHVPEYGWIIALATALQESGLHNLNFGDRDSVGLFQQRTSQGWGSLAQLQDPTYEATAFYGGPDVPPANTGLLDVPGWQSLPVTEAAQKVQHSGFPSAYADDEPTARAAVAALGGTGTVCPQIPAPSGAAAAMVNVAIQQVGKPYVFGAEGPDSFDCSGLIVYSWQQVGVNLPRITARDMYALAIPIDPSQARSGDMIFAEFGSRGLPVNEPGHVQIVVQPGTLVEAYTTGQPVRVRTYNPNDPTVRFGRFPASALSRTR